MVGIIGSAVAFILRGSSTGNCLHRKDLEDWSSTVDTTVYIASQCCSTQQVGQLISMVARKTKTAYAHPFSHWRKARGGLERLRRPLAAYLPVEPLR